MTVLYHPRPERWPQVSLKGLLAAVTLAALLMPQVVDEYQRWEAKQHLEELRRVSDEWVRHSGLRQLTSED